MDTEALGRFMIPNGIITVISKIPPAPSSVLVLSFILPSVGAVDRSCFMRWRLYAGVGPLSFNSRLLLQYGEFN